MIYSGEKKFTLCNTSGSERKIQLFPGKTDAIKYVFMWDSKSNS